MACIFAIIVLKYTKGQIFVGPMWKRRIHIMAYVITEECVSCGACAAQCPVEAISEGDDRFVIDQDTCVECGACAAQCPVEAIVEE